MIRNDKLPKRDRKAWIVLIPVLILFALPLLIRNQVFFQFGILILWYAYLTTSWNLVGGFAGVLPVGHAAFAGLGAYTSTVLFTRFGLTPWIGMFAGGLVAVIAGIIIGIPTFKLRGAYFALTTIAICEGLRIVLENTLKFLGFEIQGARGILLPLRGHSPIDYQFMDKRYYYYIILIMLIIIFYITYRIARSKLGYYLMAGGVDKEGAEALGINVAKCKLIALAISVFFTALGGTFYMQLIHYIYPRGIVSLDISFEIAFIAVIGGRGTLFGPILGSFLLVPAAELTRAYLGGSYEGVHLMLYGAVLMVVMLINPKGLMEPFQALLQRIVLRFSPQRPVGTSEAIR